MNEKKLVFVGDTDGVFAWSQLPIIEAAKKLFGITLEYEKWSSHDLLFQQVIRETELQPAVVAAALFSTEVINKSGASKVKAGFSLIFSVFPCTSLSDNSNETQIPSSVTQICLSVRLSS